MQSSRIFSSAIVFPPRVHLYFVQQLQAGSLLAVKKLISSDIVWERTKEKEPRTALLIRCTVEEADTIRGWAKKEGRTLSGHVLKVLLDRFRLEEKIHGEQVAKLRDRGMRLPR